MYVEREIGIGMWREMHGCVCGEMYRYVCRYPQSRLVLILVGEVV